MIRFVRKRVGLQGKTSVLMRRCEFDQMRIKWDELDAITLAFLIKNTTIAILGYVFDSIKHSLDNHFSFFFAIASNCI